MRIFNLYILIILLTAISSNATELRSPATGAGVAEISRDSFYCQPADYDMIYNMSSGFNAEIADDIPVELVGRQIQTVTLWAGEWFYGGGPYWQDPVGMRVNFYHQSCPPEMDPFLTIEIPWDEIEKTLLIDNSSKKLYEVNIPISPPIMITEGMSLGATILISWGSEEPFSGICATPMYTSYGACVAYLDAVNWGYYRWTAIDQFTGIAQDLGYCLSEPATAAETVIPATITLTAHPNPFNPSTTIHYTTTTRGPVELSVYDTDGRLISQLVSEMQPAGDHRFEWRGLNKKGVPLASGVYLAHLKTTGGSESTRLILLQ